MSFSSAKARSANRGAGSAILILVALLLAALSTAFPQSGEPSAERTAVAAAAPVETARKAEPAAASQPRGLFFGAADDSTGRSYHPGFETSNSAGALGFWMLLSLCAILLGATLAPGLVRSLRSPERRS